MSLFGEKGLAAPGRSVNANSTERRGHVNQDEVANRKPAATGRAMRVGRFAIGLFLTSCGITLILMLGMNLGHLCRVRNEFALPLIGGSVLTGVMLLGGGFGLMATSAAGFDEAEFDRLMNSDPTAGHRISTQFVDPFVDQRGAQPEAQRAGDSNFETGDPQASSGCVPGSGSQDPENTGR